MIKRIALFCLITTSFCATAQQGGSGVYQFLNTPLSARVTALGGVMVPVRDGDFNTTVQDPSLTWSADKMPLSLNYSRYPASINNQNFFVGKHFAKYGSFLGGVQYMNYGTFTESDVYGDPTGSFRASEFATSIAWQHQADSTFTYALNAKFIGSYLNKESSYGAAVDLSATYYIKAYDLTFTGTAKNLGMQLKPCDNSPREPLPLVIQAGVSRRLSKAPLRLMMVLQHLEKGDLTYVTPADPNAGTNNLGTTNSKEESKIGKTADAIMRHTIFGGELLFSKNFTVQIAYNYLLRHEMTIPERTAFTGVSFGFNLTIASFHFAFAHSNNHLAGGLSQFTLGFNLNDILKKHKV